MISIVEFLLTDPNSECRFATIKPNDARVGTVLVDKNFGDGKEVYLSRQVQSAFDRATLKQKIDFSGWVSMMLARSEKHRFEILHSSSNGVDFVLIHDVNGNYAPRRWAIGGVVIA